MAELRHVRGNVITVTGAFSGASTPVISAGTGSFTVARSGSTTSTVYTVTIKGMQTPVCQYMTVLATMQDPAIDYATDAVFVNVKSKDPTAGTFVLQTALLDGTIGPTADATIINFTVFLHTATEKIGF